MRLVVISHRFTWMYFYTHALTRYRVSYVENLEMYLYTLTKYNYMWLPLFLEAKHLSKHDMFQLNPTLSSEKCGV